MDENDKQFVNYLFSIGLVSPETIENIMKIIATEKNKNLNSNNLYFNILQNYINNFLLNNQDNINLIINQILNKYNSKLYNIKKRDLLLKNIILKKNNIKKNDISEIKYKYLMKWYRNILLNNKKNFVNLYTHYETSTSKKEKENLKECTFKPKINSSSSTRHYSKNNKEQYEYLNNSVYDRLYGKFVQYNLKKEIKKQENEQVIKNNTPFSPNLYKSPEIFKNLAQKNFTERQKIYKEKKDNNLKSLEDSINENVKTKYTFNPHLNKNRKSHSPKYIENKIKKKEEIEKLKNAHLKRPVDTKYIENLYNNYKLKKSKINQIKLEMEKENGITFKPFLSTESFNYTKPHKEKVNFYSFQNNQNFNNNNNNYQMNNNNNFENKKKIYTNKEKEKITKNIINRLYGEKNYNNYNTNLTQN
jgi:hypothetical protein